MLVKSCFKGICCYINLFFQARKWITESEITVAEPELEPLSCDSLFSSVFPVTLPSLHECQFLYHPVSVKRPFVIPVSVSVSSQRPFFTTQSKVVPSHSVIHSILVQLLDIFLFVYIYIYCLCPLECE